MTPNFKFTKEDIVPGTFIKTKLSGDLLVVQDLDKFNPWEHKHFKHKLLANPIKAFKPRMEVINDLLGNNRCMALGPDGRSYFPTVNHILYIIHNNEQS